MPTISDLRAQYPDTRGMSDLEIIHRLADENGVSPWRMARELGADTSMVKPQNSGLMGDLGTSLKRGVEGLPGMVTGLADIPLGLMGANRPISRAADAIGEATGFRPGKWRDDAAYEYSPGHMAAQRDIDAAWNDPNADGWDVAKRYMAHPGYIANQVTESLPGMVAGGLAGRALAALRAGQALTAAEQMALIESGASSAEIARAVDMSRRVISPIGGAAVGEGMVTAGQNMDQTDLMADPQKAAFGNLMAGMITGGIGYGAGQVANRFGLTDIQTRLAGQQSTGRGWGLPARLAGGFAEEGVLQELPQSMQEQAWQNWAEGKPVGQGVTRAGVEGLMSGGVLGMAANIRGNHGPLPDTNYRPPVIDNTHPTDLLAQNMAYEDRQAAETPMLRLQDRMSERGLQNQPFGLESGPAGDIYAPTQQNDLSNLNDYITHGLATGHSANGAAKDLAGHSVYERMALGFGPQGSTNLPVGDGAGTSQLREQADLFNPNQNAAIAQNTPKPDVVHSSPVVDMEVRQRTQRAVDIGEALGIRVQPHQQGRINALARVADLLENNAIERDDIVQLQQMVVNGKYAAADRLLSKLEEAHTAQAFAQHNHVPQGTLDAEAAARAAQEDAVWRERKGQQAHHAAEDKTLETEQMWRQRNAEEAANGPQGTTVDMFTGHAAAAGATSRATQEAPTPVQDSIQYRQREAELRAEFEAAYKRKDWTAVRQIMERAKAELGPFVDGQPTPKQEGWYQQQNAFPKREGEAGGYRGLYNETDDNGNPVANPSQFLEADTVPRADDYEFYQGKKLDAALRYDPKAPQNDANNIAWVRSVDRAVDDLSSPDYRVRSAALEALQSLTPRERLIAQQRSNLWANTEDTNQRIAGKAKIGLKSVKDQIDHENEVRTRESAKAQQEAREQKSIEAEMKKARLAEQERLRKEKVKLQRQLKKTKGQKNATTEAQLDAEVEQFMSKMGWDDNYEDGDNAGQDVLFGKGQAFDGSVGVAEKSLESLGLEHVTEGVEHQVGEIDEPDAQAQIVHHADGTATITYSPELMQEGMDAHKQHFARHEYGHRLDKLGGYSLHSMLQVVRNGAQVIAKGEVVKEIISAMRRNPQLKQFFAYPLDATHGHLSAEETQAELFAQLFSLYAEPNHREMLKSELPLAYQFIKEVIEHEQDRVQGKVQGGVEAMQSSQNSQQTQRSNDAANGKNSGSRQAGKGSALTLPSTARSTAQKAGDAIADAITARFPSLNATGRAKSVGLGLLTRNQLVRMFKDKMPSLAAYADTADKMGAYVKEWIGKLSHAFKQIQQLSKEERVKLNKLMEDATKRGFRPDAPIDHEKNVHLKADSLADDRAAYEKAHAEWVAREQTEAGKKFNNAYRTARDHNDALWKTRAELYEGLAERAKKQRLELWKQRLAEAKAEKDTAKEKTAQATITKIEQDFAKEMRDYKKRLAEIPGDYFALVRFGDHIVIANSPELQALKDQLKKAKDEGGSTKELESKIDSMERDLDNNHYVVRAFESEHQAQRYVKQLKETGKVAYMQRARQFFQDRTGITHTGLKMLEDAIDATFPSRVDEDGKVRDTSTSDKMKDIVRELFWSSLPEHHALQRQLSRRGVAGNDPDMTRAFVMAAKRDSHYLGRLKYGDDLQEHLIKMEQESKDLAQQGDNGNMQRVYEEMMKRRELDMTYKETPLQDALLSVSWFYHLAGSPAFMLNNMLQTFMISQPFLSGRFGTVQANKEMLGAYKDAFALMQKSAKKAGPMLWTFDLDLNGLPKDEQELIQHMMQRSLIDPMMEHDLGAVARLGEESSWVKMQQYANLPVQATELTNRITTALTAYRLAKKFSGKLEKGVTAAQYAEELVEDTQLNYETLNTPRLMREGGGIPAAKLVMQFRKFQQGMLYLVGKTYANAFKGASPEERKIARRSLLRMYMTMGMVGGVQAMPMYGLAIMVANLFGGAGGDDDEPFDAETSLRNSLADLLGADAARVAAKGLPTLFGVDLSGGVGLGQVHNPLPFMREQKDAASTWKEGVMAAMGAPFALLGRFAQGIDYANDGQYGKAAEQFAPRVLRGPMSAVRTATDGLTTRKGDTVLEGSEFSAWDALLKSLGMTTVKESEYYDANTSVQKQKQARDTARERLTRQWAQAKLGGDETTDLDQSIREFNSRHADVKIKQQDLLKAVQSRRKAMNERTDSGVRIQKRDREYADIDRYASTT